MVMKAQDMLMYHFTITAEQLNPLYYTSNLKLDSNNLAIIYIASVLCELWLISCITFCKRCLGSTFHISHL